MLKKAPSPKRQALLAPTSVVPEKPDAQLPKKAKPTPSWRDTGANACAEVRDASVSESAIPPARQHRRKRRRKSPKAPPPKRQALLAPTSVVPGEDSDDVLGAAQEEPVDVAAADDFSEEMAVIRRILATSAYVLKFLGVQVVRCRADKALPTTWVRYSLGSFIGPRIWEHAARAKTADDDGQTWQPFTKPKTTYHGTDRFAALSILRSRRFNVGTTMTSGLAGVWHAHLETARTYGIPSVWTRCSQPCSVP